MKKILAISGSISPNSTNHQIIALTAALAESKAVVVLYDKLHLLPYFNPSDDFDSPTDAVAHFRQAIAAADAVIIATPEYLFSLPGVLKNALEWTVSSRSFAGKPVALITAATSGEQAHKSLQLIMTTIEADVAPERTLLIQGAKAKLLTMPYEINQQLEKVLDALLTAIKKA